jgi:hypothetical protein
MSGPVAATAVGGPRRRSRLPHVAFGVLVVAVFLGTIGLGAMSGAWQTSGRTPAGAGQGGRGGGEQAAPGGGSTADVKGWMAVGDVAAAWDVPLPELLSAFGLPADTLPSTALKDLESELFSVGALRDWLAARAPAAP